MATQDFSNYFQQYLGRAPSTGEMQFINNAMERGDLDLGEIQQFIQGLPEAQQRRLSDQGTFLHDKLAQGEHLSLDNVINRAVPQVNARLAGLGRQHSSAFEGALAQQVGQQAGMLGARRQDALANFYGGGLSNIAQQYANMSMGAQQRGYQQRDMKTRRAWEIEDYYRQQNDQNNYQNAHSGWNAITPQVGLQLGAQLGGAALGAYGNYAGLKKIAGAGGGVGGAGLFSRFGGIA